MKIKLNSDQEVVDTIREGLKRTSGYCPCRVERTEKNTGTLKVGKINVDEQMELAMRFQVSSIPDRKSTRLNSSHMSESRMPSSA